MLFHYIFPLAEYLVPFLAMVIAFIIVKMCSEGEIFGGIHVGGDWNDGLALLGALEKCCSCEWHGLDSLERGCYCSANGQKSVPEILSTIRGPWALIYWQVFQLTIFFCRYNLTAVSKISPSLL